MKNYDPLSPPFKVYILDDHRFIGELFAHRLNSDPHIHVVGIGNRASAGLHAIKNETIDVVLVDMELGDDNGVEATREMLAIDPDLRIIGLSGHIESHYPIAILEAGGRGFISKRSGAGEILDGIRRVARGDLAISPDVARFLATEVREAGPTRRLRALTSKEIEVLQLLSAGYSIDEISDRLEISTKTVQTHRANMKRKLSLTTDVQLCLLALRAGIVKMHELPDTARARG